MPGKYRGIYIYIYIYIYHLTFDNQVYICKLFIILLQSFSVCLNRSQVEIEIKKRQKAEAAQDHLVNILIIDMKSTIRLLHVVMHLSYDFQNRLL